MESVVEVALHALVNLSRNRCGAEDEQDDDCGGGDAGAEKYPVHTKRKQMVRNPIEMAANKIPTGDSSSQSAARVRSSEIIGNLPGFYLSRAGEISY